MTFARDRTRRRLVPRWKSSGSAQSAPEFISLRPPPAVNFTSNDQQGAAVHAFQHEHSLGSAAEAIAEAVIEGNVAAGSGAAAYVLLNRAAAPQSLVRLAESFRLDASNGTPAPVTDLVPRTRQLLKIEPNNPVLWSDMAMHYATLGNRREALKCMRAALQLAPDHRWMLRTAARFFVHQGDAAQAHKLLATHPRTPHDPWLIAAELACAQVAERAPKFWRVANDIIRFDRFAPRHISELATAIGMMELEVGEKKRARKLVAKGLLMPTENTLAQVIWAKERNHLGDGEGLDALVDNAPDAYEAEFKLRLRRGDLNGANASANAWKLDEPFAARPKCEIAYVSAILDDHRRTIMMADEVMHLDGKLDENLELNRMFAVLSSGMLSPEKDQPEIKRIEVRLTQMVAQASRTQYHAVANLALWHYRFGDHGKGRDLYRVAVDVARKAHEPEAAALAASFAAREALLARTPEAKKELELARELVDRSRSPVCSFYLRKLEVIAQSPRLAQEVLSPSSAGSFLAPLEKPAPVIDHGRQRGHSAKGSALMKLPFT